jgi:hypothetical protein
MATTTKTEVDSELGEGFQIIRLHISADPEKDEKWAAKVKQEYSGEDWDREFDLKPVGLKDVRPVFGDYKKVLHEDDALMWRPSIGRLIYRGWDFGKVHPCVEFLQLNGLERNFIDEVWGDNVLEDQFVQRVLAHSSQFYRGCNFVDWVDVSGRNIDRWGNSSFKTLKKYGIHARGRDQHIEEGILEMGKGMVQLTNGRPYFMLNPKRCPHLAAACRGGYKRNAKGEIMKDGEHDHPVDAARYVYTGVAAEKGKSWDSTRQKMLNQYNKFPKDGKVTRR